MVDAGKLSDLLKQAEEYEENGDYQKAKLIYLDAAELALKFSKQSVKNKVKFETIAAQFIEKAKNTDLLINLSKIDSIPEKSNNNKADTKSTTGKAKSPNDGLIFASSKSSSIDFSKFPFNKTKIEPTIPFGLHTELGNHVDWNPNEEMNGFMMMVGGSGSGKTDGLKSLITELVERGYPCLVLDLHGDIEVPITSINFDFTGEYSINPLKITSLDKGEGGAIPKINQMLDSFQDSIESKFSANMITELRKTLIDLYKKMGIVQKVPDTWSRNPPNFENLNQYLNLLKDTTEARTTYLALLARLTPLLEHPAFTGKNILDIPDIFEYPLRINLKPLTSLSLQAVAADTIMRQVFAYAKSLGFVKEGENKFRLYIVIDEVKILMGFRGKVNDPSHIINILATEARKFGIGLILASQSGTHFGEDVKSNMASKMILKPMNNKEAKLNSKELHINERLLTDLTLPGEGYLITSSDSEPRRVRMHAHSTRPYKADKI